MLLLIEEETRPIAACWLMQANMFTRACISMCEGEDGKVQVGARGGFEGVGVGAQWK